MDDLVAALWFSQWGQTYVWLTHEVAFGGLFVGRALDEIPLMTQAQFAELCEIMRRRNTPALAVAVPKADLPVMLALRDL